MTQKEYILKLLKDKGKEGLNSYDADYLYHVKQAPTRVHELKQDGYTIIKKSNSNKSVNWILLDQYSPVVKQVVKPVVSELDYIFTKDGRAVPRENFEPVQEVML